MINRPLITCTVYADNNLLLARYRKMQHNSPTRSLYTKPRFSDLGKFLKDLSQFDLQLHQSEIPARTAGGTKRITGCLFNCPSARNNVASAREKNR